MALMMQRAIHDVLLAQAPISGTATAALLVGTNTMIISIISTATVARLGGKAFTCLHHCVAFPINVHAPHVTSLLHVCLVWQLSFQLFLQHPWFL